MKPGSVLVDLAVEQGGNVEGARAGEVVTTSNGVKILGVPNLPARIAADASNLYSRNLVAFVGLLVKDGALAPDAEDEILKAALLTSGGAVVHSALQGEAPAAAPVKPAAAKPAPKPKAEPKLSVIDKEAKPAAKARPAAKPAAAKIAAKAPVAKAPAKPKVVATKPSPKPAAAPKAAAKTPAAKKPAPKAPAKKK
jgi:NAD(P) transhydrogenase subunit alpha